MWLGGFGVTGVRVHEDKLKEGKQLSRGVSGRSQCTEGDVGKEGGQEERARKGREKGGGKRIKLNGKVRGTGEDES